MSFVHLEPWSLARSEDGTRPPWIHRHQRDLLGKVFFLTRLRASTRPSSTAACATERIRQQTRPEMFVPRFVEC